jgi:hypothetical protein
MTLPEPRVYSGEFMDKGGTVFWPLEPRQGLGHGRLRLSRVADIQLD